MSEVPLELSDIVEPSYLQAMLKIFTKEMETIGIKISSAIMDENAKPIIYEENFCEFCNKVRETIAGQCQCSLSDKYAIKLSEKHFLNGNNPKVVFHCCNLGLMDFCAPIIIMDKNNLGTDGIFIIGYFLGGQLRLADNFTYDGEQIVTADKPILEMLSHYFMPTIKHDSYDNYKQALDKLFNSVNVLHAKDYDRFREIINTTVQRINIFVNELYKSHHVEKFDAFMNKVKNVQNIDKLFELVVNKIPVIMNAVSCTIFTVQKGYPENEDCLVLRKTNYIKKGGGAHSEEILEENSSYYEKGEADKHLTAWVWVNAKPLLLKDINDRDELQFYSINRTKGKYNDSDEHKGFLAVPIIGYKNQVIGVIRMPHKKRGKTGETYEIGFTKHDAIFLEFLAHHLAPIIERHELLEKYEQRIGLINAARSLANPSSNKEAIESIVGYATDLLGGGKGKTYFLNYHKPGSDLWTVKKIGGNRQTASKWEGRKFSVSEGLTGKIIRDYEKSRISECVLLHKLDEKIKSTYGYMEATPDGKSAMAAPLIYDGKIYGILGVVSDKKFEFSEKDKEDLAILAEISGYAIARTHLDSEENMEEPVLKNKTDKEGKNKLRNVMIKDSYGANVIINSNGVKVQQKIEIDIRKGDIKSLSQYLRKYGIDQNDVEELQQLLSEEPELVSERFGTKVAGWIGKMISKAASGLWQVSIQTASTILPEAISKYYGLK